MTTRDRNRPAVVLLSGGMDSATTLAVAHQRHSRVYCLTVQYGQRHEKEIRSARRLARYFRAAGHQVVRLPLGPLLQSALTDRRRAIPRAQTDGASRRIPDTYVPARNTIFLSVALGYAESLGAGSIYIGATAVDYSGYPDCRPAYFRAFERLARQATRVGVEAHAEPRIETPLLRLSKAEIVSLGEQLGVPWQMTWSCYAGGRVPCGRCDSCVLRARGFDRAGVVDPVRSQRRHIRSRRSSPS
jgi:7-cyano-7-deazaguanine synthase